MEQITIAGLKGIYFPAKTPSKETPVLFIHGAFADHQGLQTMAKQFVQSCSYPYSQSRKEELN